ncbi:MAG: type I DNA topoisomerase [Candidatus Omnitrophica bacterium]|nr:type I DNA topoisomerase [Candidatus Omnitrophota bacterium]
MGKYLVIVESPTKARTIFGILGKEYEVVPSMGHIIDLPAKRISVDVDDGFTPHYRVIPGKKKILTELKKKAKGKDAVYLATDPDREGEAISWHIKEKLSGKGNAFYRVVFHEITEDALQEAFAHPGQINLHKVNAQTARRVLDRIVGYNLSPLLWKKIVRGLSAGRVQSVALKFIVEREKEIGKFVPTTTFGVEAQAYARDHSFPVVVEKFREEKAVFENEHDARECIEILTKEEFHLRGIEKRKQKRRPPPPFTTSSLQQEAYNKLRFSSQKTMMVAQRLYEGIELDGKHMGLITYMRTDSVRVAPKAKQEVSDFIAGSFGKEYLPEKPHKYKEKKGAQGAHEAIRPTRAARTPTEMQNILAGDEMRLYELIWNRFVASFMKETVIEYAKMRIASSSAECVADGRRTVFDGFTKVAGQSEDSLLPPLRKGDAVRLDEFTLKDHTTKPPPRFNDASLVKLLEEKGIGRPSTYAPTVYTLVKRNYVRREKGVFIPTDLGVKVSDLLVEHFPGVMDEGFTAAMEEKLDQVEEGELEWNSILEEFYPAFKEKIEEAKNNIKKEVQYAGKECPKCGAQLIIKWSRKGRFLSCEKYPQCKYAESITTGVKCPDCKEGELIERRNRRGQRFYGCSKFPECRFTSRTLPDDNDNQNTQDTDGPKQ